MGNKLQARILHTIASQDQFDSVGRIFIGDARVQIGKSDLTTHDVEELWREYYPSETAETRQDNLILIYFDGKQVTRNIRIAMAEPLIMQAEKEPNYNNGNPEVHKATPTDEYPDLDVITAENPEDRIIL